MQSAARAAEKAGGGCCGKTIEAKPVFGQTQSIRGRTWAAQVEIGIRQATAAVSQKTTAAPRWSQKPCPSMAKFSDTVSHGRERGQLTPYLRDAIVSDADGDRPPTRCDQLGRVMIVLFALYAA